MDTTVLKDIPFRIDSDALLKSLKVKERSCYVEEIEDLIRQAQAVARPKGIYGIAPVESRDGDSVVIEGIRFASRVLQVNLGEVHRVFPFVATCGVEIEEWSKSIEGMWKRYWADVIKEAAVESVVKFLAEHLTQTYRPGPLAMMNPGSLQDWPVTEQKNLFALFRGAAASIGVQLMESCIMFPVKSVSGIWFPTVEGFEGCQLCPIKHCPKRRALYDESLYDQKYGRTAE